ncbi:MAG: hypothetical protein AAGA48_00325 [Myxococcota bacterium]
MKWSLYWMWVALCGAIGCSGSADEDTRLSTGDITDPMEEPPISDSQPDTGMPSDPYTPITPPVGVSPLDLPTPTEPCPVFAEGDITVLGKQVRLWMDPDAASLGPGPLVFYWHATGSQPGEAVLNFTPVIEEVVALGGVVAAFYREDCPDCVVSSGTPVWYFEDLPRADEVVACAIEQVGIDPSRIHVAGTSAGGLHTAHMLYQRSNYVASVATYSGGILPNTDTTMLDPTNLIPAMVLYGDQGDFLAGASTGFVKDLGSKGHFSVQCEHDSGHGIAADMATTVWRFFDYHRYGATSPSVWEKNLPPDLPDICTR